jgi:hypothetical protein
LKESTGRRSTDNGHPHGRDRLTDEHVFYDSSDLTTHAVIIGAMQNPVDLETRWAMSYLAGPLRRDQLKRLTAGMTAT